MQSGWLLGLGIGCILAVAAALAWRVSEGRKPHEVPRAARVSVLFEQLSGGRQQ
jgi:hypothetical protein